MQVALVQEGGRTVEQVLCVQQRPQLRTKALLSAYPAEADRNPVPAGLRRVGWQVCGGAAVSLWGLAQVSDPGRGQFFS